MQAQLAKPRSIEAIAAQLFRPMKFRSLTRLIAPRLFLHSPRINKSSPLSIKFEILFLSLTEITGHFFLLLSLSSLFFGKIHISFVVDHMRRMRFKFLVFHNSVVKLCFTLAISI